MLHGSDTVPVRPLLRFTTLVLVVSLLCLGAVGSETAWASAIPETVVDSVEAFETRESTNGLAAATAGPVESEPAEAPMAFTMVGFEHPDGALVEFRTDDGSGWSDWLEAEELHEEDGPEPAEADDAARRTTIAPGNVPTEPYWTGEARWLQIRVVGAAPEDVSATVIDSDGVSQSLFQRATTRLLPRLLPATAEAATPIPVVSRAQWGANESLRKKRPSYAEPRFVVVHHTAGSNTYTQSQAPAVVRGIYHYHTQSLGWNDIGYNILVDRYGKVYEGRFGGLGRGVIGAHAAGWNTGSFGISVMGNFQSVLPPQVAETAVARAIAWKFHVHGITPKTTITVNNRKIDTLVGHRDVGSTACPGNAWYPRMGAVRNQVAGFMPSPIPRHDFSDVSSSRYYDRPISWMAAEGITNGVGKTGRFEPESAVTRAQAVTFLWRLAGEPAEATPHGFPDVSPTRYYEPAVRWAKANDITDGYGDTGLFEPDLPVTRGEMASFQWRSWNRPTGEPPHGFPDVSTRRHYDTPLRVLRAHGITDGFGTSGNFEPDRSVLRGELSAMLFRSASTPAVWRASTPPGAALFRL